jgi:hypothetical protein
MGKISFINLNCIILIKLIFLKKGIDKLRHAGYYIKVHDKI